ncbi:alpha-2-macroglobulin-like protein 1, partial [Pelodytes ibericus]
MALSIGPVMPNAAKVACMYPHLTPSNAFSASKHYAVIIPSEILALHSEFACVHIKGAEGESSIQITLNTSDGNTTLLDKKFQQGNLFTCLPFQSSNPTKENEEVATIHVSIESSSKAISKQTKVLLRKEKSTFLIQTDKMIYKPGQTVKFRIISLKENLQPHNTQIPLVELQDPEKNRIGQWLNVTLNHGIAEISLPLSPEPTLGEHTIKVSDISATFTVEEYVLPKFEVSMEFPQEVMFNSKDFSIKICSRYTYGKPVHGVYKGSVCRRRFLYYWRKPDDNVISPLCMNITGKLDRLGCSLTVLPSDSFNLTRSGFEMNLQGTVSVTEDGTGVSLSTSNRATVSTVLARVTFVDADISYKAGIPYTALVKVEDANHSPYPDKTVYVTCTNAGQEERMKLITDENGLASFTLENTTNWEKRVFITAKTTEVEEPYKQGFVVPEYGYAHLGLLPFYSRSKSFLKVHSQSQVLACEGEQEVDVDYLIKHTELDPEMKSFHLHYLVASKGSIRNSGTVEIPIQSVSQDVTGRTSFKLSLSVDVSPSLQTLVYILLPWGEMVADSATFRVQRCFNNKVSLGFSPDKVLPGSDVSLQIQAKAGSLCGIRVVDKSVVLMKPEGELTADKIYALFPFSDFGGYDYRIQEHEQQCYPGSGINFPRIALSPRRPFSGSRLSRSIMYPDFYFYDDRAVDIYSLVQGMRLKIMTSADIKKPLKCFTPHYEISNRHYSPGLPGVPELNKRIPNRGHVLLTGAAAPNLIPEEVQEKAEITRKNFPETWIWELVPVGDSGTTEVHHASPDTITDWNAGAFCMGPSGFGLAPPASLSTFQPFFVDLTMPYSVVRGESFILKASVFNYMKQSIKVQTTLKPSDELAEEPCADCQRISCLGADESKTFYWNLKATKLGEVNITVRTEALDTHDLCGNDLPIVPKQGSVDIVIKPLLVQPGGILEEKSHSSLLCIPKGKNHSKPENVSLKVPENILQDSERANAAVLGDLMGTAMQNLDKLLAMPYGCGEQNMVLFTPNIVVLQYLEKTKQLNHEILDKAKKFLESGYRRQQTYRHDDGSYSAFGKSDKEGNTWLTAFVVKSFGKARPYIFIDESHLNHSFNWLKNHRHESGCFQNVGKLFNNAMKGGVEDDISLSAYVTIALLEYGLSPEDPLIREAIACLKKSAVDVSSIYTQALLAYTFTLSGESALRQSLLTKLEEQAVKGAGQLHWERKSTPPSSDLPYWYRAPSAEVELTSYMLLTLLSAPDQDLGKCSEIVNWLSKQQNPYGGFSSTQDTIIALQALAKYAEATFSDAGDVTVTIRSQTGVMEFHVDNTNRLLLQRVPLPDIPGDYSLSATGSGCVYVQTVLRYNVPPPSSDATFAISVEVKPDECTEGSVRHLHIHISAKYTGPREKSNMVLIEIKMLSGFIPVKHSVRELEKRKIVQRSEIQVDLVTLYLEEMRKELVELNFMVEEDIAVKDLKAATVKVYDYYETGEYAVTEYNSPCSSVLQRSEHQWSHDLWHSDLRPRGECLRQHGTISLLLGSTQTQCCLPLDIKELWVLAQ